MNKCFLAFSLFILTSHFLFGQIFNGASIDKSKDFNCSLKIANDSSVIFIYHNQDNETYAQYSGKIKRTIDSLYHISVKENFGKSSKVRYYAIDIEKNILYDTDYVAIDYKSMDMNNTGSNDTIIIQYSNGQTKYFFPYDKNGKQLKFPLDKKLFNKDPDKNYYTIILKRKNAITGKPLAFKVNYGFNPLFEKGEMLEFDVIIKKNQIWSIHEFPHPRIGHFLLTK